MYHFSCVTHILAVVFRKTRIDGPPLKNVLHKWLDAWGYSDAPGALHMGGAEPPADHLYQAEIRSLLDPDGAIRAKAVFDVDGVPTVCFIDHEGVDGGSADALIRSVRERAWNQNLVSIVLAVGDSSAIAAPTSLPTADVHTLTFEQAQRFGPFSVADIQSGDVFGRHPNWFASENRVDRVLLSNLDVIVRGLSGEGLNKTDAQLLMAQVMFVAYLEHRGIVGDTYRRERGVGKLADLVKARNRTGVATLMSRLKDDFNGDLLEPPGTNSVWNDLSDKALHQIDGFLSRVDLRDGQRDFWNYDFRFIPVELISGIYESFLSDDKRDAGAYYTPRNLATLAVDQAFAGSRDILAEKVYDGACGSGILLTTAFRRMLAHAEARQGKQLSFGDRVKLLQNNIFGSDINKAACRVTAFSLYLSVLENLQPADIAKLTAEGQSRLPHLGKHNIFYEGEGDFFSDDNPLVKRRHCTLFLSNPPWVEPKGDAVSSADVWARRERLDIPRRQLCAAFMLRALEAVDPDLGRFCFILPVSVLGAATSQSFVAHWLGECEVETIINFGDLRKLLFDNAKQPTLVVVARPRRKNGRTQDVESFQYWTPKADVSFAFGRLTLHGTDCNTLQTKQLQHDNAILTSLFWGTPQDLALIARLELRGQLKHTLERDGWRTAKGFHKKDAAVDADDLVSVEPIKQMPYLNARRFRLDGPLLDESVLEHLPEGLTHVPGLSSEMLATFAGPRIVFKDGMTPEREICAAFTSSDFSFNSSTGVITAPECDADVLRFLAAYLHSDLVRYLLLLSAYQVAFERERVALRDVKRLPFIHPEEHNDPECAKRIVAEVAGFIRTLEAALPFERQSKLAGWKYRAEALMAEYFGITEIERARIAEVVEFVLPSVQPPSLGGLLTPLQARVQDDQLQRYVAALVYELEQWRDAMGGTGCFDAALTVSSAQACGAIGILRLDVVRDIPRQDAVSPRVADAAVAELIRAMQAKSLLPVNLHGNLYVVGDVVVRHDNSIYLVKPMVQRLWLQAEAMRDAERIVHYVQKAGAA